MAIDAPASASLDFLRDDVPVAVVGAGGRRRGDRCWQLAEVVGARLHVCWLRGRFAVAAACSSDDADACACERCLR